MSLKAIMSDLQTYNIVAVMQDTGEIIEGITEWDGVSAIHPVKTKDGEIRYVSALDDIKKFTSKGNNARNPFDRGSDE